MTWACTVKLSPSVGFDDDRTATTCQFGHMETRKLAKGAHNCTYISLRADRRMRDVEARMRVHGKREWPVHVLRLNSSAEGFT